MRYSEAHKEETNAKILDSALNKFRQHGYHGVGVDGISNGANVTSGAFYRHFSSKADAFRAATVKGLNVLDDAIAANSDVKDDAWLQNFVAWYVSQPDFNDENNCVLLPMQGGCALPTLSPEVAKTDDDTREVFENSISSILKKITGGLKGRKKQKQETAWATLALITGGVILARSMKNESTMQEITDAIVSASKKLK